MDFALVALSQWYDAGTHGNPAIWDLKRRVAPMYDRRHVGRDTPFQPHLRKSTGKGQILEDKGTCTLEEHQGKGLMKALAHFVHSNGRAEGERLPRLLCHLSVAESAPYIREPADAVQGSHSCGFDAVKNQSKDEMENATRRSRSPTRTGVGRSGRNFWMQYT